MMGALAGAAPAGANASWQIKVVPAATPTATIGSFGSVLDRLRIVVDMDWLTGSLSVSLKGCKMAMTVGSGGCGRRIPPSSSGD